MSRIKVAPAFGTLRDVFVKSTQSHFCRHRRSSLTSVKDSNCPGFKWSSRDSSPWFQICILGESLNLRPWSLREASQGSNQIRVISRAIVHYCILRGHDWGMRFLSHEWEERSNDMLMLVSPLCWRNRLRNPMGGRAAAKMPTFFSHTQNASPFFPLCVIEGKLCSTCTRRGIFFHYREHRTQGLWTKPKKTAYAVMRPLVTSVFSRSDVTASSMREEVFARS